MIAGLGKPLRKDISLCIGLTDLVSQLVLMLDLRKDLSLQYVRATPPNRRSAASQRERGARPLRWSSTAKTGRPLTGRDLS
jgi:hypothetical protein